LLKVAQLLQGSIKPVLQIPPHLTTTSSSSSKGANC
jgi:hypothetical protein